MLPPGNTNKELGGLASTISPFARLVWFLLLLLLLLLDPCSGVSCKAGGTCVLDDARRPVCRCDDECVEDADRAVLAPVCGTDGRTYRSACALRRFVCTTQHYVSIAYRGLCTAPNTAGQPLPSRPPSTHL